MKVIVLSVSQSKESKHGGLYKTAIMLSLEDGKSYKFDCYERHPNSKRFNPYLVPQAILDNINLVEIKGRKFIDGNSNFRYLGQRHEK